MGCMFEQRARLARELARLVVGALLAAVQHPERGEAKVEEHLCMHAMRTMPCT